MSDQTGAPGTGGPAANDAEGIDQQLDAGVSDAQPIAPGADAAADADPAQDKKRYGDVVQEQTERSTSAEPPASEGSPVDDLTSKPEAQEPPD